MHFETIKRKAIKHDCMCISSKYINCRTPLKFKCNNNHEFAMTYTQRKRRQGEWCPYCRYNVSPSNVESTKIVKRTISENTRARYDAQVYHKILNIVKENNGKLITKKYTSRNTRMEFLCERGHRFKTSSASLISNGSWCHSCKVGKRSISDMKELAAKYDGKCMSTEYKNLITLLQWKCKKGHVFMRKPQYIYNGKGFCMKCKKC